MPRLRQGPMALAEDRGGRRLGFFVPDRQQAVVGKLDGAGVPEVAAGSILRDEDWLAPGASEVGADACLIAKGSAPVAVGHQEAAVLQTQQVGGKPPHSGCSIGDPEGVGTDQVCPPSADSVWGVSFALDLLWLRMCTRRVPFPASTPCNSW